MSVDPSKNLIHWQDSSKHRVFSVCARSNFFVHGLPWVSFTAHAYQKNKASYFNSQGVIFLVTLPGVDQAPSRRLPRKVRGTRVSQNTPKNATDSAETYPKKNSSNLAVNLFERFGIFPPDQYQRAFNA